MFLIKLSRWIVDAAVRYYSGGGSVAFSGD